MRGGNWLPLIEGMLEAVMLVDAVDLKVLAANKSAASLYGLSPESMRGKPVVDFASTPEDVVFWRDAAAGVADEILSEILVNHSNGTSLQVERRISRIRLGDDSQLFVVALLDRSAKRQVEFELEKIIAELRATLESTADGILVVDLDNSIRGYNHRFAELWQLPKKLLSQRDDSAVYAWMQQQVMDESQYRERSQFILRSPLLEANDVLVLRGGRVLERVTLPQYARGRPIGRVFSYRDITQRLADESRLQLAAKVFNSSLDAIFVSDSQCNLLSANPSFERLLGYQQHQIKGRKPEDFLAEGHSQQRIQSASARLLADGFWEGEIWAKRSDGETFPCLLSMVRVQDTSGKITHFVGFFKDLTEAMAAQQRIEELAYQDSLTGLPNRSMLEERFNHILSQAATQGGCFAVLFLDLDRFKQINDSLGHAFGDRVLLQVAERLKACVRQVDMAARLGGDEFLLLLTSADARGAETTAQRVLNSLLQPVQVDNLSFILSCSIGIALYPEDGDNMNDLIKNADSAMYSVKERGRADFRFYRKHMNVGLMSRMKLDQALRHGLERNAFSLHYQPQIDLHNNELVGVEALLRWTDEELGSISPAQFIPIAEESGVIVSIGTWVLGEATRQAARWVAAGFRLPVAVNVSALQFQQSNFVDVVSSALEAAGLEPAMLELELTESILIQDVEDAMQRLNALETLGVRMAIDDFGTGYSSLSYLKQFPIRKLKIDRSFVNDIPGDDSDTAIVSAVISLGKALKLKVVAEGVETEEQRGFLQLAGCDEMQGFLISKPLPAKEFTNRFCRA